jgi:hypothetical protein
MLRLWIKLFGMHGKSHAKKEQRRIAALEMAGI